MTSPGTLPPSDLPTGAIEALRAALGEDGFSASPLERFAVARDLWPRGLVDARRGEPPRIPEAVVWPANDLQVSQIFAVAQRFRIPVIPLGSSSGVCGGAVPHAGGIILDLKRMNAIEELDPHSLLVRAQAGLNGERLERALGEAGYTLGHFPSSIYCSTVGGWVAARSAGQLSTRYGKIEDMLVGLRGVLPDGSLYETVPAPRSAFGPDFKAVVMGSEGTLGAITAATFRIWPAPASRRFRAFLAPDVRAGTEAIRNTLRRGARPAAVRLYDELDTLIIGSKGSRKESGDPVKQVARTVKERFPGLGRAVQAAVLSRPKLMRRIEGRLTGCLLIYTFEGDPALTAAEEGIAAQEALAGGLKDLGEEPARAWWGHRYAVSFKLSPLIADGFFVDTFEVACPWSDLTALYEGVRDALGGDVGVMAHFSHAYAEGCSIYFSFAGMGATEEATLALYDRTWTRALEVARRHGATQSHHHGVGFLKQDGMEAEHGPWMRALRALKRSVDPAWISNPGKLGLGMGDEP